MGGRAELVISPLTLVEFESVLAIKVRTGELDASGQGAARRRMQSDVSQERIRIGPPLREHHHQVARRLLVRYGASLGLRTLDAIQPAAALELQQLGRISVIVVSDGRFGRVARACGCEVVDPCFPTVIGP